MQACALCTLRMRLRHDRWWAAGQASVAAWVAATQLEGFLTKRFTAEGAAVLQLKGLPINKLTMCFEAIIVCKVKTILCEPPRVIERLSPAGVRGRKCPPCSRPPATSIRSNRHEPTLTQPYLHGQGGHSRLQTPGLIPLYCAAHALAPMPLRLHPLSPHTCMGSISACWKGLCVLGGMLPPCYLSHCLFCPLPAFTPRVLLVHATTKPIHPSPAQHAPVMVGGGICG